MGWLAGWLLLMLLHGEGQQPAVRRKRATKMCSLGGNPVVTSFFCLFAPVHLEQ